MNIRNKIVHLRQDKGYNCGATSFAEIFACSITEAEKICGTKKTGTKNFLVHEAIKKLGYNCFSVFIGKDFKECFWLPALSCQWPLYLSCEFINQGARGRPSTRHHAIVAANGMFYDPSEDRECPQDCFEHTFNKKLIINNMIIIEKELDGFRENLLALVQ